MADRTRSIRSYGTLAAVLACGALLLAAPRATAAVNWYTEGNAQRGFSIVDHPPEWQPSQDADGEAWTLTLDGLDPLSATAIISTQISGVFSLNGEPVDKVGFGKFIVHVDIDAAKGLIMKVGYTSRPGGTDFKRVEVSHEEPGLKEFKVLPREDGEQPGGALLTYMIEFWIPNAGASGTITIHDFTFEYEEYVPPLEDDDDDGGGGGNGGGGDGGGDKDKPTGVAYMGGSDGGSGSGTGSSGTGSGQGGGNSAGVRVGEGAGSIDTDALVATSPRSTAGDTVTGYPLRLEDVTAGGGEAGGGTGDGAGEAPGTGASGGAARSGLSWKDLVWLAAALAVTTPFVSAALDRRRVRRRLRDLIDETPDGPAPGVTAPA